MDRWLGGMANAFDWSALAVAAALLVAAAALCVAVLLYRRMRRIEYAAAELGRSVAHLQAAVRRQQKNQQTLAAGVRRSDERIGQVELRATSRPYEQAIRMAAQGGSEDRLMRYFGLTDGEASLVRLLHGDSRRSKSSDCSQATRRA